jgi:hypothetical protein
MSSLITKEIDFDILVDANTDISTGAVFSFNIRDYVKLFQQLDSYKHCNLCICVEYKDRFTDYYILRNPSYVGKGHYWVRNVIAISPLELKTITLQSRKLPNGMDITSEHLKTASNKTHRVKMIAVRAVMNDWQIAADHGVTMKSALVSPPSRSLRFSNIGFKTSVYCDTWAPMLSFECENNDVNIQASLNHPSDFVIQSIKIGIIPDYETRRKICDEIADSV